MKSSAIVIVRLLLFFAAPVSALAQDMEWETLNNEAVTLVRIGQYDRAVAVAKRALDVAEKLPGPNHEQVTASLFFLAELYRTQGQHAQAEPLFKRSLAIIEKALGPNHPEVAEILSGIADLYRRIGRDTEAVSLEARAARIRDVKR